MPAPESVLGPAANRLANPPNVNCLDRRHFRSSLNAEANVAVPIGVPEHAFTHESASPTSPLE